MLVKKDLDMGLRMINKIIETIVYKKPVNEYNLNNILNYVVNNTEYYKNFNPDDLSSFPILTKDIIRNNFEGLKSKNLNSRKWWINTSGGSTGEPVKFIQDKEYLMANRYSTYAQKRKIGYQFGDSFIKLWGDEREILKYSQSLKTKLLNKIKNIVFLNSFNMSQENMFKFINEINNKQPKLIVAYAQAMYELAKFVEDNNLKIEGVGAIITSAGTLYPFMRECIERNFNTKVYNRYGSREVGNIACEEPGIDGLVISDYVHIEIIDENGNVCQDGIEGEIIVTSLVNYAMPLIRYRIGDRGILNTTKYDFPILEKVSGRNVNMFKKIDGSLIDGEYFTHLLYHLYWIDKFQIIQKDYKHIVINIVPNNKNEIENDIENIKKGIYKVLGQDCFIDFNFVEEILPLKSGKFLYTICEVNK
jgi:phenylacetate-CoA ligase